VIQMKPWEQIIKYFSIAFALMFLVIVIHFKSFTHGIIIVAMIPLAWLGATWGHGIEGHTCFNAKYMGYDCLIRGYYK